MNHCCIAGGSMFNNTIIKGASELSIAKRQNNNEKETNRANPISRKMNSCIYFASMIVLSQQTLNSQQRSKRTIQTVNSKQAITIKLANTRHSEKLNRKYDCSVVLSYCTTYYSNNTI